MSADGVTVDVAVWTTRDAFGDDLKVSAYDSTDPDGQVVIEITTNYVDDVAPVEILLSNAQAHELFDFLAQVFGEVNGP